MFRTHWIAAVILATSLIFGSVLRAEAPDKVPPADAKQKPDKPKNPDQPEKPKKPDQPDQGIPKGPGVEVKNEDVPAAVLATATQYAPGFALEGAKLEEKKEGNMYRLQGTSDRGETNLTIGEDGTLWELRFQPPRPAKGDKVDKGDKGVRQRKGQKTPQRKLQKTRSRPL